MIQIQNKEEFFQTEEEEQYLHQYLANKTLSQLLDSKVTEYFSVLDFHCGLNLLVTARFAIKIWKFEGERLYKIQTLRTEIQKKYVSICFHQNSNYLLSADEEYIVKLWRMGSNHLWEFVKQIKLHYIQSLTLNEVENQFIARAYNRIFILMIINEEISISQEISNLNDKPISICLNKSRTEFATLFQQGNILILEIGADKFWRIKQQISNSTKGLKAFFAGDHELIISTLNNGLLFYEYQNGQPILSQNNKCIESYNNFFIYHSKFSNDINLVINKYEQVQQITNIQLHKSVHVERMRTFGFVYLSIVIEGDHMLITYNVNCEKIQINRLIFI